ncbi:MAG: metallophosphoesterase [Candidatus Roizmanbacteria bacterium]|nr:MAG: metallophosphoesterase [Candidatus Roizmanbacteria bacterium]
MNKKKRIRIAAIADIHIHEPLGGIYRKLFKKICEEADYLLICGDLTQRGLEIEAKILVHELTDCHIPVLTVLGNHDYEGGEVEEIKQVLRKNKMYVLEGEDPVIFGDIGFAGVKGFCGGFEDYMLTLWGEEMIKRFYYEGVNEAQKLETALAKLQTKYKIVLLHYSPVKETVVGESPEIFTYLGSSQLERPINNYQATMVFHGHAHGGKVLGKTSTGIPVYNVSHSLLEHLNPNHPYVLIEL